MDRDKMQKIDANDFFTCRFSIYSLLLPSFPQNIIVKLLQVCELDALKR